MLYLLVEETEGPGLYFTTSRELHIAEHDHGLNATLQTVVKHEFMTCMVHQREQFVTRGSLAYGSTFRRIVEEYVEPSFEEWCSEGINHTQERDGQQVMYRRVFLVNAYLVELSSDDVDKLPRTLGTEFIEERRITYSFENNYITNCLVVKW